MLLFFKKISLLLPICMMILVSNNAYANYNMETIGQNCENIIISAMTTRMRNNSIDMISITPKNEYMDKVLREYFNKAYQIKTHPIQTDDASIGSKNFIILEKFLAKNKPSCINKMVQDANQEQRQLAQQRNQPKSGGGINVVSLLSEGEESVGFLDHRKYWQKKYAVNCKNGGGAVIKNEVSGSNMEIVKYCIQPNASYLMNKLGCHSDLNGFDEAARYVCQ